MVAYACNPNDLRGSSQKDPSLIGSQWLMPVILAIQEVEIRRVMV
jgi:hypothetical protein